MVELSPFWVLPESAFWVQGYRQALLHIQLIYAFSYH